MPTRNITDLVFTEVKYHCYEIPDPSVIDELFQPIRIELPQGELVFRPSEYLKPLEMLRHNVADPNEPENNTVHCLTIKGGLDHEYMFGQNWLINKKVAFDIDKATVTIQTYNECNYRPRSTWNPWKFGKDHPLLVLAIVAFVVAIGMACYYQQQIRWTLQQLG